MARRAKLGEVGAPRHVQITVFCLLAMLALTQLSEVASARSWLKIWNNIGPGQKLWVACYYDLFTHGYKKPETILFGDVFYVKFYQVRLVKQRWWCSFEWENTHRNQSFTVWEHHKGSPMPVGCTQCLWAARPDGWYVWDKSLNQFVFYRPWLGPVLSRPGLALAENAHNKSSQAVGFPYDGKLHN